jgi:hypothetical protein
MRLTSEAFQADHPIPPKHAGDGGNVSPPLAWDEPPEGTRSFALLVDDPDAPSEEPFVHWIVYRIPAGAREIPEGSAGGGVEGRNSAQRIGWFGPCPPEGHGTHHYRFRLSALDIDPDADPGADREILEDLLKGHVLAEGELVGTCER